MIEKFKVVQKLGQAGYNLLLKVSAPPENLQKIDNKKAGLIRLILGISLKKTERGCQEANPRG